MGRDNNEVEKTPRQIPANGIAERAVIGSLLLDPTAIEKIEGVITPADCFVERNQFVMEAALRLHSQQKPIDPVTLNEELARVGLLVEVGVGYLSQVISETHTALYIEHYAQIVRENSLRRKMIAAAGKVAGYAYDEESSIEDLVDRSESAIMEISNTAAVREPLSMRASVTKTIDMLDRIAQGEMQGVASGFVGLDRLMGGFQRQNLIILAARPGMGKSSLALNIARNAAHDGCRVGVFSLEMSNEQLTQRLLAVDSRIPTDQMRNPKMGDDRWATLMAAANKIADLPIRIDDTPALTVNEIRQKSRRMAKNGGLDMIIIDYLQLIRSSSEKSENRHHELGKITKALAALAKELDVPVICLSQLNRALESRSDKRPILADLRESGSIEEDANAVIFIYREDYYNTETERQNIADIIVAKHRDGATGTVSLYYRRELTEFCDIEITRTELNN